MARGELDARSGKVEQAFLYRVGIAPDHFRGIVGPPTNLPKPSPGGVGKPDLPGKVGGPFGGGGPFGAGGPFGGKGPGGIPGGVRPGR